MYGAGGKEEGKKGGELAGGGGGGAAASPAPCSPLFVEFESIIALHYHHVT